MMHFFSRIAVTWLMMSYRVESTKEAVMLRISYLLRSDAKKNFETDQHYFDAHDVLSAKLGDEIKSKQAHPFVISLVSDCVRCHETVMQSAVTVERYRVISAEDAVFYGSLQEIKDLQALHSMSIKYFIPLIPDAKIDAALRSLYTMSISDGGCNGDAQDPQTSMTSIRISIIIAPLSDIDLATFITEMLVLEAENNSEIIFEFEELLPEKERSMQGTIVNCQNVLKFAVLLSKRREVLWIERRHDIRVNNKWARGICQSGSYADTPAFTSNLTGADQIVGVADTGLDLQSCYFYDPNVQVPYNTISTKHRKVVTYIAYQDMVDDSTNGHGTHVCGSLLGRCYKDWGEYRSFNGVAYNAKIAFYDIGLAGSSTLNPPSNLESGLFGPMYSAGARIFSNSWGNSKLPFMQLHCNEFTLSYSLITNISGAPSDNTYNYLSVSVDRFMWNNPDALVIFAAGNDGPYSSSIDAPSTNKNGIAVGASLNDYNSWILYGGSDTNSETADAGSTVYSGNSMSFFSSQGPTADGRLKPDVMAPGWWITSAASATPPSSSAGISMYNSSATSHCTMKGMRGTSMSTPIVAGNAALIREYFTKGYYPSGIATTKDAFIPSGALLKAMLIHSARPLIFTVTSDSSGHQSATPLATDINPSNVQGFGRIQLNNVLNFADTRATPLYLFIIGAAESSNSHYRSLRNGETEKHIFYTTSDATQPSIRITLVYTDYPGASGSTRPLVNDLNIVVVDTNGATLHRPQSYIQGQTNVNNVQLILIDNPLPSTTYTVVVSSSSTLAYAQSYSLVMTGQITPVHQRTIRSFIASIKNYYGNTSSSIKIASALILFVFLLTVFICIKFHGRERLRIQKQMRDRRRALNFS